MIDLKLLSPEVVVLTTALITLLFAFLTRERHIIPANITVLGLILAIFLEFTSMGNSGTLFMLRIYPFTRIFNIVLILGTLLLTFYSMDYFEEGPPEIFFFFLTNLLGMMLLADSVHLLLSFLALELISFSLFVLVGIMQTPRSTEASLKFFLVGSFSSSIILMGIGLLLYSGGNLYYDRLININLSAVDILGLIFLLAGFGFKLLYVPFMFWAPDVFEGAPTPVTALLSSVPKAAAFALLIQLLYNGLLNLQSVWKPAFTSLAVLSMIIGNIAALREQNLKRMLAYSSIAHAGYILIAFAVNTYDAYPAVAFYLVNYVLLMVGAFAGISMLNNSEKYQDLYGLGAKFPLVSIFLTIIFIGLTGIPPTGGFMAKLYLFKEAVGAGRTNLAIWGFLNSVVSAFYYLRVPASLYMETPHNSPKPSQNKTMIITTLWIVVVVILYLGLFPDSLFVPIKSTFF